ncbi:MAG: helix-turn-helix domain-containing protein [Bacteroidaceae bacterium]|nr:helix-turn-helix domain-containing protein [Bacteroidaceae bacterium]
MRLSPSLIVCTGFADSKHEVDGSLLDAICKALDCQPGDILEYRD